MTSDLDEFAEKATEMLEGADWVVIMTQNGTLIRDASAIDIGYAIARIKMTSKAIGTVASLAEEYLKEAY